MITFNDGRHIDAIIYRQECKKHGAEIGVPCFRVPKGDGYFAAICNQRAVAAGADGEISESSLRKAPAQLRQRRAISKASS